MISFDDQRELPVRRPSFGSRTGTWALSSPESSSLIVEKDVFSCAGRRFGLFLFLCTSPFKVSYTVRTYRSGLFLASLKRSVKNMRFTQVTK